MKSAIILGGGPAGCQCALWLKLLGLSPLLLEKKDKLGGLSAISPYPNEWIAGIMDITGQDFAQAMQDHLRSLEVPVYYDVSLGYIEHAQNYIEVGFNDGLIQAHYLVIAIGVQPRHGLLTAAENILVGPGEHIFNFDFHEKRVAVLGGGDNGAENYAFIKAKHPASCHLYAKKIKARSALWSNVDAQDIFLGTYEVDQANMQIWFEQELRAYDVFVVMYGWETQLPCVFNFHRNQLLDETGFIVTDAHCRTKIPRFFAIGEVTKRMHPCIVTAMADGVVAAKAIQAELEMDK